ncbi:hypothetical protein AN2408.2 [Paecilomyces variotii No. 5]|uniref:Heterokaryon incompatibility domain-containing protein n=1 Tax=Byssochlamys spectabilis (strain No. 5 / NBRC 109023) TaxID=1356009 RepID=V5FV62_BYSSN|nr:hypothetical protein AN2408.2 [Paecilomyces variotii No. 5]
MDHIEEISDPAYPPLKIRCLSSTPYDQLDWPSYPERAGWAEDRIWDGDFSQHESVETEIFLQNWLYFGVLWVLLGENGCKKNYVTQDVESNDNIITTKLLDEHIYQRTQELRTLAKTDQGAAQRVMHDIERCLMTVAKLCRINTCVGDIRGALNIWPLSQQIDLSVRVLAEYLCTAFNNNWPMSYECLFISLDFMCAYLPISRMLDGGRCRSEINMVATTFSSMSAFFMTQLKPSQKRTVLDHSKCSDTLCEARQIDESTYKTQHTSGQCTCDYLGPVVEDVVSILRSERIPLLSLQPIKSSPYLSMKVEPFKEGKRYIALSHVWSDGLGNPHKNELPQCQLHRIKGLLDDILSRFSSLSLINMGALNTLGKKFNGSSLLFWMDTLCIPVENQYRKDRSKAIKLIKKTFENAFRVLVLDAELQGAPLSAPTESFMRITISPWRRRLWTLQEAVCAQRLYVKFMDGFFDVQLEYEDNDNSRRDTNGGWLNPRNRQIRWTPHSDARSLYWEVRTLRLNVVDRPDRKMVGFRRVIEMSSQDMETRKRCNAIMQAFLSALHRSTSRKEDEFICMASLVGWDLSLLHGVPFEYRMHALLSVETALPQGLLFMNGPRMLNAGWSWAVRQFGSFHAVNTSVPLGDLTPGTVDKRGFSVKYPGLALSPADTKGGFQSLIVCAQYNTALTGRFQIRENQSSQTPDGIIEDPKSRDSSSRNEVEFSDLDLYVIFWDHTHRLLPSVSIPAAIVSTPRGQTSHATPSSEILCKFEFLATLEILEWTGGQDLEKPGPDNQAQWIEATWVVQ